MPKIYKQNCKNCGKYYEGVGRCFCSQLCSAHGIYNNFYGKKHTQKTIEKNRQVHLGKHSSPKAGFQKGHIPWMIGLKKSEMPGWKGGPKIVYCSFCNKKLYKWLCKIRKNNFCNVECRGKYLSKNNLMYGLRGCLHPSWKGGKPNCIDCNKVVSNYGIKRCRICQNKFKIGKNHHLWRGGLTSISTRIRHSFKYEEWRNMCFQRDGYICQLCKKRSDKGNQIYLHAHHHIISFSKIINSLKQWCDEFKLDLYESALKFTPLWDINNGQTLCIDCHKKTSTYAKRGLGWRKE